MQQISVRGVHLDGIETQAQRAAGTVDKRIADALKTRIPQILGGRSYAIYIGQTFGLLIIRVFEQRVYPPPMTPVLGTTFISLSWWLEPLLLVIFCIGWGAAMATFIEHPAARKLKRIFG